MRKQKRHSLVSLDAAALDTAHGGAGEQIPVFYRSLDNVCRMDWVNPQSRQIELGVPVQARGLSDDECSKRGMPPRRPAPVFQGYPRIPQFEED